MKARVRSHAKGRVTAIVAIIDALALALGPFTVKLLHIPCGPGAADRMLVAR